MDNKIERLKKLDDNKLIDVVKNYRQYGYDDELRNSAINILESRGVDMESLKIRGDFENKSYDDAKSYFNSFEKLSKIAFVFYGLLLIIKVVVPMLLESSASLQILLMIIFCISLIGYIISLIKSFISQSKYYDLIGKKESQLNPGLYFTVGMFLYIIMYFVFRKQMREDINLIR